MTSLPIHIPSGFEVIVKKGDKVSPQQILAQKVISPENDKKDVSVEPQFTELPINIAQFYGLSPDKVRTLVKKNPGDSVRVGEIIASKSSLLGTKKEDLISQVAGTVLRFERASGILVIRIEVVEKPKPELVKEEEHDTIVSPLAGIVSLCNNEEIVLETTPSEAKKIANISVIQGILGTGPKAEGELTDQWLGDNEKEVMSIQLTADAIDKILLVSGMKREAYVKSAAIGVKGIISSQIAPEDISYMEQRHKDFTIVQVDDATLQQIASFTGKKAVLDGFQKTIMIGE